MPVTLFNSAHGEGALDGKDPGTPAASTPFVSAMASKTLRETVEAAGVPGSF